ncbi:hypothetical protein KUTeg_020232, partial [Tegillarca granosa]
MTNRNDEVTWKKPLELFENGNIVKICAPMVRYSKLPFRMLVRKYNCDLAFTPMIVSNSFISSIKARDNEFTTCKEDRPLIVQFAADNAKDFADAAEIISPFADGVDLNCGCPQRWALQEGYGAALIKKPELRAEHAGVSWITIHGRTKEQRSQPVNLEAIKIVKENTNIPIIANGDIKSVGDICMVQQETRVDGVMTARGLLQNPAMFAGYADTPLECVRDWVDMSILYGLPYQFFHNHLIYMLEKILPRLERRVFNALASTSAVVDYLRENYDKC